MKIRSSFFSNFFHGSHILDWVVPWTVTVDTVNKILIVRKRNYYLIGVDKTIIPIKQIINLIKND